MNNKNEFTLRVFMLLAAVFAGTITIGIALGSKLINIFGLTASVSAITYPITFLITDVVAEVWGKHRAKQLVWIGFIVIVLVFILIRIAIVLPEASFWEDQEGYTRIFGTSLRLIFGGTVAYLISQLHDVWAFHFWKKITKGKHLWLRNNFSTWVSQFIDTSIFIVISFTGLAPLIPLILGQYIIKVAMAALDTPFIYLLVNIIRKKIEVSEN